MSDAIAQRLSQAVSVAMPLAVRLFDDLRRKTADEIGVTRDYLKVGDAVKARCHQLKDGSNGCLLGFLKGPDGVVKNWDGDTGPVPSL